MAHFNGENVTILVVDDEECLLNLAQIVLVKEGYTVLSAITTTEALCIAQSYAGEIDLLLTDMRMPNMDGATLSLELRKFYPNFKVVYMTAFSRDEVARQLPKETVLSKPFTLNMLCDTVRDSLACPA